MRRYIRMINRSAACLIGAALLLAACEKSDNNTEGLDIPDSSTRCLLQPPTIGVMPFGGGSPATRAAQAIKEEQQAFNVGEELGNIITLGNSPVEETPQTRTLTSGAYCRVVIYKLEDWNNNTMKILEQRLCKQGSTDYFAELGDSTEPIYLYPGDYKIFCYSFNKTTTDKKMAPLTDGTPNVLLSDGDDFISVVKDLTITAADLGTNVALGTITLQHRCCRLIGILKSSEFNGSSGIAASPAPTLSAVSTFTTQGKWSIKDTDFMPTATTAANTAKAFTLTSAGESLSDTLLILPLTNQALSATYNFKPNGSSTNITASNKYVNTSTTFNSGGSYSITIKAIGAYVPSTESPVIIGSYKWAPANLNKYKYLESNAWTSGAINGNDNDYWRWNVLNVDTSGDYPATGSQWASSSDPCREGLGSPWCVPPKEYFDDLIGYALDTKKVHINGATATTNTNGWVEVNNVSGCVFVDDSRGTCTFLPATGSRFMSKYYQVGYHGTYWSSKIYSSKKAYTLYVSSSQVVVSDYDISNGLPLRCSQ